MPVSFPGPVWPLSDWLGRAPGDFLREFLTGPEGWDACGAGNDGILAQLG